MRFFSDHKPNLFKSSCILLTSSTLSTFPQTLVSSANFNTSFIKFLSKSLIKNRKQNWTQNGTLRHSTSHFLPIRFAEVPVGDQAYNWLVSYIENRSHYTRAGGESSLQVTISLSVVQGSAVGPVAFIINAQDLKSKSSTDDLKVVSAGNALLKYADDTYLIVPASKESIRLKASC